MGGGWGGKTLKEGISPRMILQKIQTAADIFRRGLVVVVMFCYDRRLICLMVGLMFGCPTPAPRLGGWDWGFFVNGITNCVACGGNRNNLLS